MYGDGKKALKNEFDLVRERSPRELHRWWPWLKNPPKRGVAGGEKAVKPSHTMKVPLVFEAGEVDLEKGARGALVNETNPDTCMSDGNKKTSYSNEMSTQVCHPMKTFNKNTIDSVQEENLWQGDVRVVDTPHVDEQGRTPLHEVIERGLVRAEFFTKTADADVAIRSKVDECAALGMAARGHLDKIRELTRYPAAVHATACRGQTALHWAAFFNMASAVEVLMLEAGAQIDVQNRGGRTPLHVAAATGSVDALLALLRNGASMMLDKKRLSPLHLAAKRGHVSSSKALLDAGAVVSLRSSIGECSALDLAATSGHAKVLEVIIPHMADVNATDSCGRTVLHRAACFDQSASIDELFQAGANLEVRDRGLGWTPLHDASAEGSLNAIAALLRHGANKDSLDVDGRSPLHLAAEEGHLRVVQSLLSAGADPSLRYGKSELNVLNVALLEGHVDVMMEILKHGADVNAADSRGLTALHHAAFVDEPGSIELLVKAGANVEAKDSSESTALLVASEHGYTCAVEVLLTAGANVNFRGGPDDAEWSALDLAAVRGYLGIIAAIVRHGADVNARNSRGYTALHHAAFANMAGAIHSLADAGAEVGAVDMAGWSPLHDAAAEGASNAIAALLLRGVNRNLVDRKGRSALHLAAHYGHLEATKHLLAAGTDVTCRIGESENAALDIAVIEGHLGIMRALIRRGADVNAADSVGGTALYRAALFNQVGAIDVLLNSGANMSQADDYGRTPLHVAIAQKYLDAAAALCKQGTGAGTSGIATSGIGIVQDGFSGGERVNTNREGRDEDLFFLRHADPMSPTSKTLCTPIKKWSEREVVSENETEPEEAGNNAGGDGSARTRVLPRRAKDALVDVDLGKAQVSHPQKSTLMEKTRDEHADTSDIDLRRGRSNHQWHREGGSALPKVKPTKKRISTAGRV